ncbi:MAG: polysaccharide pyruvyl transferase CsaB [Defluviitaleaceae bacterium]|nr:polysaccharide pyruvyl transferase CsaB [Defluviitaleaceae bacterium]
MNAKMDIKILVAIMSMEIGGAETHVLELCKSLQKKGMKVYVASNGGAYEPELVACGVVHYKVPLHNKRPFNIIGAYRTLKKIIIENDIRLVHAHARIPAFLCGFLQRKLNFRFVTTAHWVFTTKFPYNLLSNWGEKSLAVSEDIKDYLVRHYRVPKDDIYVTINGVDTDKFSPSATMVDGDFSGESPRIMSISRLDKDRSLAAHLLIEAAPILIKLYPNVAIYLVGSGNDYDNIQLKAEAMNARLNKDVIKMTGPQVDIHRWLAMTDIFVGASRAVLEAMAVSKPVVASGNEGYMGLINEENLPISIATNFCYRGCGEATVEKLTTDLITILDKSPQERENMGKFGREFVLANYSVDRMADDAISLYHEVLASPSPVRIRKTDIMISGYYGYNNSGDDLLLKSIVRDLKNRQADLSITVLSKRPKETRAQYGVNAIYRFNFIAIWRLLKRTRLLLTGGGSVIQDLTSTHSLIYYLWIIKTARRLGVKNMLYANGIGPIRNANNIERMRRELNEVELITLREETSGTLLADLQVQKPKIIVTADPAFSLPTPDFDSAKAELKALGIEADPTLPFICIAIRSWRHNPPGFEQHVARFADYIVEKYNYAVLFMPMRPSDDTEISKKTISLMKHSAAFLENPRSMDSVRGIVGLSAFTVAMRLHTLIYAINLGVPVIGLAYDPKVEWLMETVDQHFYTTVEEIEAEMLMDFANKIIEDKENVSAQIREAGQKAQILAEKNADLCMELLNEYKNV